MPILPGRRRISLSFLLVGSAMRRCLGRIIPKNLAAPRSPGSSIPTFLVVRCARVPAMPCAEARGIANSTYWWSAAPVCQRCPEPACQDEIPPMGGPQCPPGLRCLGRTVPRCRCNRRCRAAPGAAKKIHHLTVRRAYPACVASPLRDAAKRRCPEPMCQDDYFHEA